jgi:3-dehydroquinate dehydratase-2
MKRAAGARPLRVLVISGPNLQLLGRREPEIYGRDSLESIHAALAARATELGAVVDTHQTNHEGAIVDLIGAASTTKTDGIVLNPGAYTHTSIAIFDALKGVALPAVEVHLSNPDAREAFRRRSRIAPACLGRVAGFGARSYLLALDGLVSHLRARDT